MSAMLSSITTKIALKKMGISADTFNFTSGESAPKAHNVARGGRPGTNPGLDDDDADGASKWPAWMSVRALPLTVQPWLSPVPPPIPVADAPRVGELAPIDRDRKLVFGGGKRTLIVFLRCVGCAFAQKTFLALRTIANKYAGTLQCVAISHSSAAATQKWMDLLGGAWNVQVVIDEDRAVYAAWGLGTGSFMYLLNYNTQVNSWKEKGWLGKSVAGAISRTGTNGRGQSAIDARPTAGLQTGNGAGVVGSDAPADGPTTIMGNKWQETGAWAVDGRGKVVWGAKALRADDVPDLDAGVKALGG